MKKFRFSMIFCALAFFTILACMLSGCATAPKEENAIPELEEPASYEQIFPAQYKKGLERAEQIETILIQKGCSIEEAHFAAAVVFPELTRYKSFRGSLESIAVKYSSKDYSIGIMQMKMSFAVEIEQQLGTLSKDGIKLSEKYPAINFGGTNETSRDRKNRAKRLINTKTQCDYLLAFIDVYSVISGQSEVNRDGTEYEEQNHKTRGGLPGSGGVANTIALRQTATAYNAGFQLPKEKLEQFAKKTGFPYGGRSPKSHWNYGAIAEEYYAGYNSRK